MSTYLKKWLAFAAIAAMLILPGCRVNNGIIPKGDYGDILEYTYDGCIYLRQFGYDGPMIHSETCNNPKHGGIFKSQTFQPQTFQPQTLKRIQDYEFSR